MLRHLLLLTVLAFSAPASASDACGRLLVSGYFSTVHIYDACTGAYDTHLGPGSQLGGPQALRLHGGLLYVVAEQLGKVQRYRPETLAFVDTFIDLGADVGITGIAFGPDGDVYVGGYTTSTVYRFDAAGGSKGTLFAPRSGGLRGPDNGLVFGPDGQLYIPGYDSHNVLRWNPATGQLGEFIAAGSGGLARTRVILFERSGGGVLVTGEGSNRILRYHADGRFDRALATLPAGYQPNGLDYAENGELLVTGTASNVLRIDAGSGAVLGELVAPGSGGLAGATFLLPLPPATALPSDAIDVAQVGSQYWLTGAGLLDGNALRVDDVESATGTAFGDAFDAGAIVRKRWGAFTVEFTGCNAATLQWDSTGDGSAGFGAGGYPLQRLAPSRASRQCETVGFGNTETIDWVSGSWFGGATRSGEGLFLDVLENDVVVAAFFTHRPLLE